MKEVIRILNEQIVHKSKEIKKLEERMNKEKDDILI